MECVMCQSRLDVHESLMRENGESVLQSFKNVSNADSQKGTCNVFSMLCNPDAPIDVSLCKDCTTSSLDEMKRQLAEVDAELINYDKALQDLSLKSSATQWNDVDATAAQLQRLTMEEATLLEELRTLEEQEAKIKKENRELDLTLSTGEKESDDLYRIFRNNHRMFLQCSEECQSYQLRRNLMEESLEMLKSMSTLDIAFCISIHENYGTINGLRLGRLPHEIVEWTEINAAFGQVALLMQILSERVGIIFTDYEIVPRGNNSAIRRLSGTKTVEYPLHGSGGWKPFGQSQLDHAIVGLLQCLIQIEAKLRERHNAVSPVLMYRMKGEQIIDNESPYRVKMQFNSEERWTKAMKLLLLNLKRAIAISVKLPEH
uniref:APG6 domain-containing protein n=2 Tax=Panagrellus redivivus TaxID=6233 RepID=A0A7E4W6P8_PANRE